MLNSWKALNSGDLVNVDKNKAFPMMRWMSSKPDNLQSCARIDELFFSVPSTMVISLLYANCKGGFLKYPKATKIDDTDIEELIKKYLCKLNNWSAREYEKNKMVVNGLNQKDLLDFLNKRVGFDKKECKIAGIDYTIKKFKFVEEKKNDNGCLDMFM